MRKREKIAKTLADATSKMGEAGFKFLFRTEGMEPYGIVTKEDEETDPDMKTSRKYVEGVGFNGNGIDTFKEYLDWVNPYTTQLESCVAFRDDLCIVTARRSNTPDNDPNNFLWLANGQDFKSSEMARQMMDRIGRLRVQARDLRTENEKLRKKKNLSDVDADLAEHETSGLEDRLKDLSDRLREKEASLQHYQDLIPDYVRKKLEDKGRREEVRKGAEEAGAKEVMDDFKKLQKDLKQFRELKNMESMSAGNTGNVEETMNQLKDSIKSIEQNVERNSEDLAKVAKKVEDVTEQSKAEAVSI